MRFEHSDDVIRELMRVHLMKCAFKVLNEQTVSYFEMEHAPDIQCGITDEDMLLLRIDMALDTGDVELFMQLTNALKGESYAHCT